MKSILLIGGKSSRMGIPKHTLTLNNQTFFDILSTTLSSINELYISCSKVQNIDTAYPIIFDEYDAIGPMNGIYSSIHFLNDDILIVPCDQPLLNKQHLENLLKLNDDNYDAIILKKDEKIYPTIGIYHKTIIPYLEDKIKSSNYKMMNLLNSCKTKYIDAEEVSIHDYELLNINTKEDYQQLKNNYNAFILSKFFL